MDTPERSSPESSEDNADSSKQISSTFNDVFDHFLIFAEKVLQHDVSGELLLSSSKQSNAIQTALKGYRKIYNRTRDSPKHKEKFQDVYVKCRPLFLKEVELDDFMDWFQNQNGFVIAPQAKSRRNRILLTVIFRKCCKIAEYIIEQAEKYPDKADQYHNDPAGVYPETFMLHIFRLFYYCADETDRRTLLQPKIEELETTLGLRKNEVPQISDGLNEIFSAAKNMAHSIGLNVPKETPNITGTQFRQALNAITQDEQTKATLKGMFDGVDLQNPKNIPGAIGKILERMQQNAQTVPEPVQRSLNATADDEKQLALPAPKQ